MIVITITKKPPVGHFLVTKPYFLSSNFNPILDEGAPTSTGGIENVVELADILGIGRKLLVHSQRYSLGWGIEASNAKPISYTWNFVINGMYKRQHHRIQFWFS